MQINFVQTMIQSVTRKEYYQKTIFIFVAFTLIAGGVITSTKSVSIILTWLIAVGISLVICLLFLIVINDMRQRKIIIENDTILIYNLWSVNPVSLKISEVIDFETKRQKLYSNRAPINDGFRITNFSVTQQRSFTISQEQYENYSELVNAIVSNLKSNVHVA